MAAFVAPPLRYGYVVRWRILAAFVRVSVKVAPDFIFRVIDTAGEIGRQVRGRDVGKFLLHGTLRRFIRFA